MSQIGEEPARAHSRIRLAADLDALDARQISRLQVRNWKVAVQAAMAAPGLRERLPELATASHPRDVVRLPIMSSADLEAACPPQGSLLLGATGLGLVLRSSGTSGRRKVLYHSWAFNRQVAILGARGARQAVPAPIARLANCLKAGGLYGAFNFANDVGRRLGVLTFPMGTTLLDDDVVDVIREHRIDTLVAAPRFITDLVCADSAGALRSLRVGLYIGAPLDATSRQDIAAARPDLAVRSFAYSTSETGPIGYQCPYVDDGTHHLHEDAVIVEVVDERTGEPAAEGTTGDVIVTPLSGSGMGLFRYRIGDRGQLRPAEPCRCGSVARRLVLRGRAGQSIIVDTTNISGDLLLAQLAMLDITQPGSCQLQVRWTGKQYSVRLLVSSRLPGTLDDTTVRSTLRARHEFRSVLDSPRCTGFSVERVEPRRFATNEGGKTPLLYQVSEDRTTAAA